jgi:hypothetical protein
MAEEAKEVLIIYYYLNKITLGLRNHKHAAYFTILASHSGGYDEVYFLGYNAV